MCTRSIDDLLPHAPLHYAATGEMVKGSLKYIMTYAVITLVANININDCTWTQFTYVLIRHANKINVDHFQT